MAAEIGWPQWPGFSAACMAELEAHAWPGNVRELRNVVERAVYRWNEPGRPVAAIMFDPFASPWKQRPMTVAKVEMAPATSSVAAANGHGAVRFGRAHV